MTVGDPLTQAALELNQRIARLQRRLTVVTVVSSLVSGLVASAMVFGVVAASRMNVRATAWVVALSFAAAFFTVIAIGELMATSQLRRLVPRWTPVVAAKHSVDAAALADLALPIGIAPPTTRQPQRARARFWFVGATAAVFAGLLIYLGGATSWLVAGLIGVMLTAVLHWYLGWRSPK
jgi:hypothetical protein